MAFLQRHERNKERWVLFQAFLYATQVENCLCVGERPQRRVCLAAAAECHHDVRLFELADGVSQLS